MVKTRTALDAITLNAASQTPYLNIDSESEEGTHAEILLGKAVVPIDPQSGLTGSPVIARSLNAGVFGTSSQVQGDAPYLTKTATGLVGLQTNALGYTYNATANAAEVIRTPTVYNNVTASAAGATAVWTAGVGKRWRLQGICITLMKATTAAAASKLTMLDVAAATGLGVDICAGAMTATPEGTIIMQGTFKNGILAAATNTALNVNLVSALAAGGVSVQVWGTEE